MLELLAAVCLVRGGHEIILAAFENFKEVRGYLSVPSCIILDRCWEGRQRKRTEIGYGMKWLDRHG